MGNMAPSVQDHRVPPKQEQTVDAHVLVLEADPLYMSVRVLTATNVTAVRPNVRYRCTPCEVAWTTTEDEQCWVCGEKGESLRSALALREDEHLHLDFG